MVRSFESSFDDTIHSERKINQIGKRMENEVDLSLIEVNEMTYD
jgi:hypothetical protein